MAGKGGRLSRWSTLKSKGGASTDENQAAAEKAEAKQNATLNPDSSSQPEPNELSFTEGFPENRYKRSAVPAMMPLAGVDEHDTDFEAPPAEALALLNGEIAHTPPQAVPTVIEAGEDEEEERELTPEEAEAVAALPPIETLTTESDFTPFMSGKVPEFIRRRALRVLWRSHPVLTSLDGLNDYDEDFNIIHTLIDAATQTSYKVGKGQEAALEEDEVAETPDADGQSQASEPLAEADGEAETDDTEISSAEQAEAAEPDDDKAEPEADLSTQSIRDVRKPGE